MDHNRIGEKEMKPKDIETERQRYIAVIRIIKMLDYMNKPNGRSVNELAEKLQCSTKTIARILVALQEHQFPIWDEAIYDEYSGRTRKHWCSGVKIIYDSESTKARQRQLR